jgi:hypothetical protein
MAAPWGAIIQAIDHAMGRMQHGAEAGIKVAGSNTGGAAANTTAGAGTATGSGGGAAIPQTKESTTPAADSGSTDSRAAAMPDVSSEGQKGDSDIGANVSETGGAAGESGGSLDIGSIGGGEGSEAAAGAAGDAGDAMNMLSDANAKNSTDVSSDEGEAPGKGSKAAAIMGGAKKWAEGASKGFANAGAIATGNKAAYSYTAQDTGEATNSIGQQKAKEWAEKVWENRRNKKEDASKTSDK